MFLFSSFVSSFIGVVLDSAGSWLHRFLIVSLLSILRFLLFSFLCLFPLSCFLYAPLYLLSSSVFSFVGLVFNPSIGLSTSSFLLLFFMFPCSLVFSLSSTRGSIIQGFKIMLGRYRTHQKNAGRQVRSIAQYSLLFFRL